VFKGGNAGLAKLKVGENGRQKEIEQELREISKNCLLLNGIRLILFFSVRNFDNKTIGFFFFYIKMTK